MKIAAVVMVLMGCVLFALVAATPRAPLPTAPSYWVVLMHGDSPAGYVHVRQDASAAGVEATRASVQNAVAMLAVQAGDPDTATSIRDHGVALSADSGAKHVPQQSQPIICDCGTMTCDPYVCSGGVCNGPCLNCFRCPGAKK